MAAINYGVFGVPETFIVDTHGVIMAKLVGAVVPGTLDRLLQALSAGSGPVYQHNNRFRTAP